MTNSNDQIQPVWQIGLDGLLTKKYLEAIRDGKIYLRLIKNPKKWICGIYSFSDTEIGKTIFFDYKEAKQAQRS